MIGARLLLYNRAYEKNKHRLDYQDRKLCEMEKRGEQGNISEVAESNQFQQQRGADGIAGSINKRGIESRNNQSDQLLGSPVMEQNVRNQETRRMIEKNNGLSTSEYIIESSTFYNDRIEQGTGNMEEGRLGKFDGHQVCIQSCGCNWRVGEIPSLCAQRSTLYSSGNGIRDFSSNKDLCKGNINNSRQSEKQDLSTNNQMRRQQSVPDAGFAITRERDRVDSIGVQEILMDDQREQEQVETGLAICIPGMDVQLSSNGNLVDQREKEGIESICSKIDKASNGIKITKNKKRSKFGWQASIFHSVIQTRRTTSIANKQINGQGGEDIGQDK
ncbi:MAG: hypothetical protein EZS28_026912 [Streblomastix strix]|uniref:Uncharacterized protein n=1 Tax=Streblomastix strix TaxID=222440 RepID=A0A5J4V5I4_9EUKA|nr:MAG: hypothetical protein EZS28_026912 [Streblomastix strix]